MNTTPDKIARQYLAVWSEPDPVLRESAVAELWSGDATEYVESTEFHGHPALHERITEAYQHFVENGTYTVTSPDDVFSHHDAVTFTIQLTDRNVGIAWAARVFLMLDQGGRIQRDYQFTVQPLQAV
jgi:hypothetical protein